MIGKGRLHLPVIAFVTGGILSYISGYGFYLLLCALIYWLYLFRHTRLWMIGIIISFSLGYFYLTPSSAPTHSPLDKGIISSPIKETSSTIEMVFTAKNSEEKILVTYIREKEEKPIAPPRSWLHGATCEIKGDKTSLDEARNPGQFDYSEYMARKGIHSQVLINSTSSLSCQGRSIISYAYQWRQGIIGYVERSVPPRPFAWIVALIFGNSEYIGEETIQWFRDFGLSHLLAISGLHVGLTMGVVFFVLFRSGIATIEQAQGILMFLLPLYCFIAGAAPSVIRASLMAMLLLMFLRLKLRVSITDVLSLVCLVFLLASPSHITHIGFQFSFLVTLSLFFSFPILAQYKSFWVQSAIISFVSQLSILPLQIHYFYEFNPLSLVANVILVPYFSFIVIPIFMFLLLFCLLFPGLTYVTSKWMVSLHEGLLGLLKNYSQFINVQWTIGEISVEWMFLYFVCFVAMMQFWKKTLLNKAFMCGVFSVAVIAIYSLLPYMSAQGTITMLDIGQGDAFVIELPYRRGIIMIDAAGPPVYTKNPHKTAEQVIIPYLQSRGISWVDALMVSHGDTDHSGSMAKLIEELEVREIIISSYFPMKEEMMGGAEVLRVKANEKIVVNGQQFEVLHPGEEWVTPNDNSLVITCGIGGLDWLFTGDISSEVEEKLLEEFPNLQTDVLKVGHHGSKTSTSEQWVRKLNPSISLISAGRNNRYGHPHQEVVERLERGGVEVLQTKEHGAVQYKFSGASGTFSGFLPYNASRD